MYNLEPEQIELIKKEVGSAEIEPEQYKEAVKQEISKISPHATETELDLFFKRNFW